MSKLPIPNSRLVPESPPIKNRKALADRTDNIINSPVYSNGRKYNDEDFTMHLSSIPPPLHPLKFEQQRQTKTSIPSQISRNLETRQRLQKFAQAGANITADKKKRSSFIPLSTSSFDLRDPVAVRRQNENMTRLSKMIQVLKDKERLLDNRIETAKSKNKELAHKKILFTSNAKELKASIIDTEVQLENMAHQIQASKIKLEKTKLNLQKQMNVKIMEDTTELRKGFDEVEAFLQKELQMVNDEDNDDLKEELLKLKNELEKKDQEYKVLKDGNDQKLETRKKELQKESDSIIKEQELKDEEFTKKYEHETELFEAINVKIENSKLDLLELEKKIKDIETDIRNEQDLKVSAKSTEEELIKELELLRLRNGEISSHVSKVSEVASKTNKAFQLSKTKLNKEKKLRCRIQNSIEDLKGKLRIYGRIIDHECLDPLNITCNKEESDGSQNLTLNNKEYRFNKVFSSEESEDDIIEEIITLSENNLNGANVSIIFIGQNVDSLLLDLSQSTIDGLIQREERYKDKKWKFEYHFQIIAINENGVTDLVNGSKSEIKLENRNIILTATTFGNFENIIQIKENLKRENTSNMSTFVKLTVKASNEEKYFTSSTNFLNLSKNKGADLILNAVKKIEEGKFSSQEFSDLPMYQLVHSLYSNTKALTFFNIVNNKDNLEEDLKLLDVASFVNTVNFAPVKRVYSSKSEK